MGLPPLEGGTTISTIGPHEIVEEVRIEAHAVEDSENFKVLRREYQGGGAQLISELVGGVLGQVLYPDGGTSRIPRPWMEMLGEIMSELKE